MPEKRPRPAAAPEPTDEQLVDRARSGDERAFRLLVERYEPRVAAVCRGMEADEERARDLAHRVFVRFFRALDRFRGDAALSTYLTRIAVNLCLNEARGRSRRVAVVDDEAPDVVDEQAEDAMEAFDRRRIIRGALDALDARYRAVIVLRLVEGYSTRETAEILDVPVGTVLSRLARGQKKLQELLRPYLDG